MIHDQQTVARKTVERWGRDLALLMQRMPDFLDKPVAELQELLSPPVVASARPRQRIRAESQNYVPPQTEMEKTIAGVWQGMFGLERVGIEENFFDLGGHSLLLVQMHGRLQETLKMEFSIVTLFEHPTVRSLARHLGEPAVSAAETGTAVARSRAEPEASVGSTADQTQEGRKLTEGSYEGIAIIGMTGRFPGAESVEELWANLVAGKESISFFGDAELAEAGLDAAALRSRGHYVPARGILKDADCFDAAFFGIHPREAEVMDPQHRLFLEICWAALERAGYAPSQVRSHRGRLCGRDLQYLLPACAPPAAGPDRVGRPRTGDVRQ